jgi:hypothetical protein
MTDDYIDLDEAGVFVETASRTVSGASVSLERVAEKLVRTATPRRRLS